MTSWQLPAGVIQYLDLYLDSVISWEHGIEDFIDLVTTHFSFAHQ
jgi:hypothetical protein